MKLEIGDTLYRLLPEYQVWHTGIICRIDKYHQDYIYLFEFDDTDEITLVPLRNYLWGRKYFWVATYDRERELFGDGVFRSTYDRIKTATDLYRVNNLRYTVHRYNCEYFTRRCVFNDPVLWPSPQTIGVQKSRVLLAAKLFAVSIHHMIHNFSDNLEFEKEKRPTDIPFYIDKNGEIKNLKR